MLCLELLVLSRHWLLVPLRVPQVAQHQARPAADRNGLISAHRHAHLVQELLHLPLPAALVKQVASRAGDQICDKVTAAPQLWPAGGLFHGRLAVLPKIRHGVLRRHGHHMLR